MKRILLVLVITFFTLTGFAQNAKTIYNKYSNKPRVSGVFISPTMFSLIGSIPELEIADEDVDITPIVKNLEGMYIIDSENNKVNEEMRKDLASIVGNKEYELLMEAKDEEENVRIYIKSKEEIVSSFIMVCDEGDELVFIMFDGAILAKDLSALLK